MNASNTPAGWDKPRAWDEYRGWEFDLLNTLPEEEANRIYSAAFKEALWSTVEGTVYFVLLIMGGFSFIAVWTIAQNAGWPWWASFLLDIGIHAVLLKPLHMHYQRRLLSRIRGRLEAKLIEFAERLKANEPISELTS